MGVTDALTAEELAEEVGQAQLHLTEIRARAGLVSACTAVVNAARGLVKSYGERLRVVGIYLGHWDTSRGRAEKDRTARGMTSGFFQEAAWVAVERRVERGTLESPMR